MTSNRKQVTKQPNNILATSIARLLIGKIVNAKILRIGKILVTLNNPGQIVLDRRVVFLYK